MEQTGVVTTNQARSLMAIGQRGVQIQSIEDLWRFAKAACETDFVPKAFRGSPEKAMIAMEFSLELGLPLLAGLRSIEVINGRPAIYGDLMLALVRASGLLEQFAEDFEGVPGTDEYRAVCVSKRHGFEPKITPFSVGDAKKAKLWGKMGPWTDYPSRMLQMRARSFNLRDNFTDVLMGLVAAEEAMDIPSEPLPQGPPAVTVQTYPPPPQVIPPEEVHPTTEQIKSLRELISSTGVDPVAAIREFFELPTDQRLTLKYLCERLTMADYTRVWDHYAAVLKQQVEEDIGDFEPPKSPVGEATSGEASGQPEEGEVSPEGQPDGKDREFATVQELEDLQQLGKKLEAEAKVNALLRLYPPDRVPYAKYREWFLTFSWPRPDATGAGSHP